MKDAILFFCLVLVMNFLFRGEPNLYDLLHAQAIKAASMEQTK